tara:strand:- start:447 stop:1298 length:852 start_codon:yes stop_codon:yes gene_type:complete
LIRVVRRLGVSLSLIVLVVIGCYATASAHDPVFLTDDHFAPEVGPYLPDGTISFAMYGRLEEPTSTQGFQARMQQGQSLNLSLLVPAVLPEIGFEVTSLPEVKVIRPDQTSFLLSSQFRQTFYEPFTGTTYLRLADYLEEAQQGEYSFLISGKAAGRYVVSIGTLERFGTEVRRYTRPLVVGRSTSPVVEWFETQSETAAIESPEDLNYSSEKVASSSEPEAEPGPELEPGPEPEFKAGQGETGQSNSRAASDTDATRTLIYVTATGVGVALAGLVLIRKLKR